MRSMRKQLIVLAVMLMAGILLAGCGKIEGYHYADSETYSAGDFSYAEDSIDSVEINWIAGNVYIDESVADELSVYEESGKELTDDEKLRYKIDGRKLIIQFCKSDTDVDDKKKDLYVKLPILLQDVDINVVSANAEMVSSATGISCDSVSGELYMYIDQCENLEINSVSGDSHVILDYDLSAKIDFDSVSGKCKAIEKTTDKTVNIDCHTVSGNLEVAAE